MARPPRPAPSEPADRSGQSRNPFDELARLRGTLREERVFGKRISRPASAGQKEQPGTADAASTAAEADLFQAAVQGVKPLPHANRRAEIQTPKPPPIPRPQTPETKDDPPTPTKRRAPPKNDAELFRFAVEDVRPIDR